jgi:protein-disulfide isomerase
MRCAILLFLTLSTLVAAQNSSDHGSIPAGQSCHGTTITADQATAILQELQKIRLLLEQSSGLPKPASSVRPEAALQKITVPVGDEEFAMGSPNAPITLVEFTDFQCPYCRKFHKATFPQLKKEYIDSGKVRFISRDLPLGFHSYAKNAALQARCAGEQSKYWEMRDQLFTADTLSEATVQELGRSLELDVNRLQKCILDKRTSSAIDADLKLAEKIGVSGTPSFLIGKVSNGMLDGFLIRGAQPFGAFRPHIEQLISSEH